MEKILLSPSTGRSYLPYEVYHRIFERLSVKILKRSSHICRQWWRTIQQDTYFINHYFKESQQRPYLIFQFLAKSTVKKRSTLLNFRPSTWEIPVGTTIFCVKPKYVFSQNPNIFSKFAILVGSGHYWSWVYRCIIGCAGGLVCLQVGDFQLGKDFICFLIEIINPSTLQKIDLLSSIKREEGATVEGIRFGFGKRYTLLCILRLRQGNFKYLVYQLGDKEWREIQWGLNTQICDHKLLNCVSPSHCINGYMFWGIHGYDDFIGILSFPIEEEQFNLHKIPNNLIAEFGAGRYFQLVRSGKLCLATIEKKGIECVVNLYSLDLGKSTWIVERILCELPQNVASPPSGEIKTFSKTVDGITCIRLMDVNGKVYLYWRSTNQSRKEKMCRVNLYELDSGISNTIVLNCQGDCSFDFYLSSYVQTLQPLKQWADDEKINGDQIILASQRIYSEPRLHDFFLRRQNQLICWYSALKYSKQDRQLDLWGSFS